MHNRLRPPHEAPTVKPPRFRYARPETLDEALHLLAEHGDEARVLAGGQSLIPLLNFRLARPEVLIDITMVEELRLMAVENGTLRIGAAVTQRTVERSEEAARACPLLTRALPFVGHLQNRTRGTVAGSIAHADPAAELPAVAAALDAVMVVRSSSAERTVPAGEFFFGPFTTALETDEILVEVRFPSSGGARSSVVEISPRSGDFAVAGAAGLLLTSPGGRAAECSLALFGVGGAPQRLTEVEDHLKGRRVTSGLLDEAEEITARTALADSEDIHADAAYRARVAGVLVRRAVEEMAA